MAWLGLAVAAFAIDALRGSRRGFVLGALAAGAALVVGLGALNPQAAIVRVNAGRARSSVAGFDAAYATTLGADAVPALLDVLSSLPPRPRCAVARDLAARAAAPEAGDWRSLDFSRRRARARLAASRDELAAFVLACPSLSYAPRRG